MIPPLSPSKQEFVWPDHSKARDGLLPLYAPQWPSSPTPMVSMRVADAPASIAANILPAESENAYHVQHTDRHMVGDQ